MTTRAERIHQKENYAAKQQQIARVHGFPGPKSKTHATTSAATCGNPDCVMCGNPRKVFKELTIQERRMFQKAVNEDV